MTKKFPKLSSKLVLAPMHDITNIAFRLMCKKYGAALVSTELLSANAIARDKNAILKLAKTSKEERPVACQLFSQNTENLVKSGIIAQKSGFDIIDINFGCPSKKIIKQGSGGALLKRKNKIAEIVKAVSSSIEIPLTVKIRLGTDKENINVLEIAKTCEENGASAITLHARTVDQGYSGKADWEWIKKVKEESKIPIIGNGDIISGKSAKEMIEFTGCDYLMIGRAAIGNPFIFKEINHFLSTGEKISQSTKERINDYFEYIELTRKYGIFSFKDAKQKAQEFTKGIPGSSKLRLKINKNKSFEELEKIMREYILEQSE